MASLTFIESLYKDHPSGRSIHGYIETITQVRRDDPAEFHGLHYGPRGIVIAIELPIRGELDLNKVGDAFRNWGNDGQLAMPSVADMPRQILR